MLRDPVKIPADNLTYPLTRPWKGKKPGKLLQNKRLTLLSAEGALLELSGCGVKGEDVSGSPRVTERHIRCYICRLIFLDQNYSVVFS